MRLTGTVPSYPQYLAAAAATRRVAGVTGVHNGRQAARGWQRSGTCG